MWMLSWCHGIGYDVGSRGCRWRSGFHATCDTRRFAESVATGLVVYSVPESGGKQMSHLNTTIEISCHYPSQIAWANFRDWRQAQKAAQKLNGQIFGCRQPQAKLDHTTVPPGGSVSITNIPLKTRPEDLRRFIHGACDLKVKPPKYTISDIKRNLPIRKPGLFRDIFNER